MPKRATLIYVVTLGAMAAAISVLSLVRIERLTDVLLFALLTYAVEMLKRRIGSGMLASMSSVVAVATYPVVGPWGGPILLTGLLPNRSKMRIVNRIFNVSQGIICTFVGGLVYVALGGPVGSISADEFPEILIPVTAANFVWHLGNFILVTGVLRIEIGMRLVGALRSVLPEVMGAFLGYSYLGFLLAILWLGDVGVFSVILLLPPLLAANWAFAQYGEEQKAHQATLQALAQAIETKDLYTRGHGERVSRAARILGAQMGWDGDRLEAVAQAGLLHDVGKIGVPTRVLQKDGKLTEEEYDAIKLHPLHGVELVGDIAFLEDARAGIMHHHERYDGGGYPSGLAGEDIPIFARVLAIADAFDCMTSVRSYRPARSVSEALNELIRCKGKHFDPKLVDLFVAAIRREGWAPAPAAPAVPPDAVAAAYDHDDPTQPPPVEPAEPRGGSEAT
jgi:hypothetical protein